MNLPQGIIKQFRRPTGNLGYFVGWLMAVKNKDRSRWTIQKLNFKPTDYLLEIGYGPGTTLKLIADHLSSGFIAGIDHSETMHKLASKRNKSHIDRKKVKLECGIVSDLNYSGDHFDIIFGSNVLFFWKDPVEEFQKLYPILKPGGRLVMVFQPRWATSKEQIRDIAETTKKDYVKAGYKNIELDFKTMKPLTCIYISGQKIT